jgi:YHS domain-containing protein
MRTRDSRTVGASLLIIYCLAAAVRADQPEDTERRDIPAALAPLEFLVGSWKGPGVLKNNPAERFRGWTETHTWAWVFAKGRPVALSVSIRGGKLFERATLTHDDSQNRYRLEGKAPGAAGQGQTIVFEGNLDSSGKLLTLERKGKAGQERLTIRANSNYIRYTLVLEDKEEGAVLFKPRIEVGLTKEGESFAAGSTVAARAVCIVTGSAASMTVSYQGQTYPICCTGCRDEFNDNPEKYLKKLSLKAADTSAAGQSGQPRPARVSRFEDAFAGDVQEPEAKPAAKMTEKRAAEASSKPAADSASEKAAKNEKAKTKVSTSAQLATRASTWLSIGRNLEKSGKTADALGYYRRIVKECPGTPSVKTATERIKALSKP